MIDASLWSLIALILFIIMLIFLGVPKAIKCFLDDRAKRIASDLNEAQRLKQEANELLETYKAQSEKAKQEAEELIAYARSEAARIVTEAEVEMEQYLAKSMQLAKNKIEYAEMEACKEVRNLVIKLSGKVAEDILSTEVNNNVQKNILQQSIQDIKTLVK
ncbi:hypothetical protein [Bartonella sp. DGB1]|uniref:F0F1 ATP synthase subunit B family protein n=1 Tax=Bartonella sp. DGB1 TaxID=3239807 RepID=UPI003523F53B